MKKVLFIGHDARRMGGPMYLLHLAKWLQQNSDLSFEFLLREGGDLLEEFKKTAPTRWMQQGLVIDSKVKFRQRVEQKLNRLSLSTQLHKLYPADQFPLVYSNTVTNGQLTSEFAALGRRIICHAHEMEMAIERWGGPTLRKTVPATNLFIATSSAVRRDLQEIAQVPVDKIEIVNGFGRAVVMTESEQKESRIRIRQQLGVKEGEILTGFCGTLDWRKGADLFPFLARAVNRLKPQQPHRLLWIGSELNTQEHRQLCYDLKRLGVSEMASAIAPVPNSQEYFTAFDIFGLLSREDPFPMVMLEAASLTIPMVCFEGSGGADELVTDHAGVAVSFLDVDLFAKAIVDLGNNKTFRQEIGQKALSKTASQFTLETQAPKLLAIIRRYLA